MTDTVNVRPKLFKWPGIDCKASAVFGEVTCDLDLSHGGWHFDAEYKVYFNDAGNIQRAEES